MIFKAPATSLHLPNMLNRVRPEATFESYNRVEGTEAAYDTLVSMCDKLTARQVELSTTLYPWPRAQLVTLTGPVGVGKTHLLESVVNRIKLRKSPALMRVHFCRKNVYYVYQNGTAPESVEASPLSTNMIIVWDDFLSDYQTLDEFMKYEFMAKALMAFFMDVYENRRFVLMNSNFSLEQMAVVIRQHDKIGRVTSRLNEMLAVGRKLTISATDYREKLAEEASGGLLF